MLRNGHQIPRFLIAEVISPHTHRDDALTNLEELESLVATFGGQVVSRIMQHRIFPDKATYVGAGKVQELQKLINMEKINAVVLNAIVNPGQIFRLEKELWRANPDIVVWDRVDLILAIFEKHATSTEAKLQIELAQIEHMGPRIYGLGGKYFSKQAGGIGTRGLGETNIELMKRQLKDRTRKIKDKLSLIQRNRENSIRRRKLNGLFTISLIGYTNSGKTTLFNSLTGKEKLSENVLFSTLDATLGRLNGENGNSSILISDTIGFIKDLPPVLVDAFKSTLLEAMHSNLLIHVIDISDPNMREKMAVVESILHELSINPGKVIIVYNKIDKVKNGEREKYVNGYHDPAPFFISARKEEGIAKLSAYFKQTALTKNPNHYTFSQVQIEE